MAYATTVYPAKVALKAALEAHTFAGGQPVISWGAPTESDDLSYEMIYFGPTNDPPADEQLNTLGAGKVDEVYTLKILAEVYQQGDDEQAVEQRAWQFHDGILTVLCADHTIDGTVNRITGFRARQVTTMAATKYWRSQILIEVAVVGLVFT